MPYGKVKCDTLVFDNAGIDTDISLATVAGAAADKIYELDTSVEAIDSGTDGNVEIKLDNNLKFKFTDDVTNSQGIFKIYGGDASGTGAQVVIGSGSGGVADITFKNASTGSNAATYQLPLQAPTSNGYSLRSDTNGEMQWANPAVGTTATQGDASTAYATTAFVQLAALEKAKSEEATYVNISTNGQGAGLNLRYAVDTTASALTFTLPASPVQGQFVVVYDSKGQWATNNLTLAKNGSNIAGAALDLICNVANAHVTLIYSGDATLGWIVK
tara:strand:+ start:1794 stop:2612 length:819 start_codon:yes stop_codon:yes gene_type:complete